MLFAMGGIFICYRRADEAQAGRLKDRLEEHFGKKGVYQDVEADKATQWDAWIEKKIAACRAMVVVIGKDWAGPRLHEESDVVRGEIRTALEHNKTIAPVLFDGASMPKANELPEELAGLPKWQATSIGSGTFDRDVDDLVRALDSPLARIATHLIAAAVGAVISYPAVWPVINELIDSKGPGPVGITAFIGVPIAVAYLLEKDRRKRPVVAAFWGFACAGVALVLFSILAGDSGGGPVNPNLGPP